MSIGDFSKYVIYAHSVSRIPSRDNFVEHIVNGVGFHEVGRVGSEPSIRVKDVECFSKRQPNLLRTNKVEMIFEAINLKRVGWHWRVSASDSRPQHCR
jgi:hypothetical protein